MARWVVRSVFIRVPQAGQYFFRANALHLTYFWNPVILHYYYIQRTVVNGAALYGETSACSAASRASASSTSRNSRSNSGDSRSISRRRKNFSRMFSAFVLSVAAAGFIATDLHADEYTALAPLPTRFYTV